MIRLVVVGTVGLLITGGAFAQEAAPSVPAKASTADTEPAAICTDRPSKATSACTVPEGAFQVETDVINWTRLDVDNVRTDTILYTSPTLKYGVTSSTDVEANIAPFESIRTRDANGVNTIRGVGDLYLKVKQRLSGADAKAQFAIIPYLKVPTAKFGIGNRKLEGGMIATGVFTLPSGLSLTVTPEIDDLENADLHGHHAQLVSAVNVSKTLSPKITANAELWTSQNYDPTGTIRQYSADGAIAYVPVANLQFDAGVNIGLNRYTPGLQIYFGAARRF